MVGGFVSTGASWAQGNSQRKNSQGNQQDNGQIPDDVVGGTLQKGIRSSNLPSHNSPGVAQRRAAQTHGPRSRPQGIELHERTSSPGHARRRFDFRVIYEFVYEFFHGFERASEPWAQVIRHRERSLQRDHVARNSARPDRRIRRSHFELSERRQLLRVALMGNP